MDNRYYTRHDLQVGGVLDHRYYTETEVDAALTGYPTDGELTTILAAYAKLVDASQNITLNTLTATVIGSGWTAVSYVSGWGDSGGGYGGCRYKKMGDVVLLRGRASRSSGVSAIIITLPAGYRPPAIYTFPCTTSSGYGAIDIDSSGNVTLASGATTAVSLSGIIFGV